MDSGYSVPIWKVEEIQQKYDLHCDFEFALDLSQMCKKAIQEILEKLH